MEMKKIILFKKVRKLANPDPDPWVSLFLPFWRRKHVFQSLLLLHCLWRRQRERGGGLSEEIVMLVALYASLSLLHHFL